MTDISKEITCIALAEELSLANLILKSLRIDCEDSSCRYSLDRSGQRTNGGCRCLADVVPYDKKRAAETYLRALRKQ